jgi:lysophospholipase L1-like esterase
VNPIPLSIQPVWASDTAEKETIFFIDEGESDPAALLLFPPDAVLAVTSADESVTFEAGRDYVVDAKAGRIVQPRDSRIPVTRREDLAAVMNGPDDELHRRQTTVTYVHQPGLWREYESRLPGGSLPRLTARLRNRESIAICLTGDSISEGYNASGFMGMAPRQPPFGALVASALERGSQSPMAFHNFAVAGWTADNGIHDVERIAVPRPDLVIVAYGMNDAGYAEPGHYIANIEAIIAGVRASHPSAEFILVSPMLPNPEWDDAVPSRFPAYRDALARLSGSGTALADLTTLWTNILRRKSWFDLAGNGFNHPNDYGHRLYARAILASLTAPRV